MAEAAVDKVGAVPPTNLNAELNEAVEFWIVRVPEIEQLVQISVISEDEIV